MSGVAALAFALESLSRLDAGIGRCIYAFVRVQLQQTPQHREGLRHADHACGRYHREVKNHERKQRERALEGWFMRWTP